MSEKSPVRDYISKQATNVMITISNNCRKTILISFNNIYAKSFFDKPTQSTCSHNVTVDYSNILPNLPRFCYCGRFFSQSNRRQADYLPCSSICYGKTEPTYVKHTAFSAYYDKRHFDGRCVSHVSIVKNVQIILSRMS